jgi:hypothetical protein
MKTIAGRSEQISKPQKDCAPDIELGDCFGCRWDFPIPLIPRQERRGNLL